VFAADHEIALISQVHVKDGCAFRYGCGCLVGIVVKGCGDAFPQAVLPFAGVFGIDQFSTGDGGFRFEGYPGRFFVLSLCGNGCQGLF
jgi:hypothetical protein